MKYVPATKSARAWLKELVPADVVLVIPTAPA
jgi:hypothetical protein